MRSQNVQALPCPQDPRRLLCESKYFSLRPQPLEQYLYRLKLSQACERVFWLHWDAGYRNGDFTSEIPLSEVARRVGFDISSVTRAYQRLRSLGLIQRQDPGRDPTMPFSQAVAVTEVRIPREALPELLAAPDRKPARTPEQRETAESESAPCTANFSTQAESPPTAIAAEPATPAPDAEAAWASCQETLKTTLSERDFTTWIRPLQAHAQDGKLILFAPNPFALDWITRHAQSQIDASLRAQISGMQLILRVGTRPTNAQNTLDRHVTPRPPAPAPREIHTFSLARLRKQLAELNIGKDLDERLREIVWSVEQGALAKYELKHAINIALKLVRTGTWTRPNRMPPNWRRAVA